LIFFRRYCKKKIEKENRKRKRRLKQMAKKQKKKKITVMVICSPNGVKCNICGAFIPEGDSMCCNGHEPGKEYPVPTSNN